jgi:hypothetical protein
MEKIGIFYSRLKYIMDIWYILCPFGNFVAKCTISTVLVNCVNKNLASLLLEFSPELKRGM